MRRDTTSHAILELAQRLCCRAHFSRFELYWRLVSRALLSTPRDCTLQSSHMIDEAMAGGSAEAAFLLENPEAYAQMSRELLKRLSAQLGCELGPETLSPV